MIRKIAVLTSGGDCQGMNACLNIIVKMAEFNYISVYGVKNGYQGLIDNDIVELKYNDVRNISHLGGTVLKSARSQEFMTLEGQKKAAKNLKDREIDALIVIGGDGSFRGVMALNSLGVKTAAIPGTIDNDLHFTESTLGFDTAVNVAANAIESIKQTMAALDRCSVIEVMGRNCGAIALHSAAACCAEVVVLQEKPFTRRKIVRAIKRAKDRGIDSPTVVVAENLFDIKELAKEIETTLGIETKTSVLGYIQRGGAPSVADRILAMQYGVKAIELLVSGKFNRAIGIKNGKIIDVSMEAAIDTNSNFNEVLFDLFSKLNSYNDEDDDFVD